MTEDSFVFTHSSFKTDGQPNLRCWNPSVCIIPTRFSGMVGISKHTVKAYDSYAAPLRLMLLRLFQHQFLHILASSSATRIGQRQQVNAEPIIVETLFAPVSSGSESLYMNRSKARNAGASMSLIFMCCCALRRLSLSLLTDYLVSMSDYLVSMSHFPARSSSSQSIHCPLEKVSGSHQFKIAGYSRAAKLVRKGKYIETGIFYVCGHAWTIRWYPPGTPYPGIYVALASDATNVRALYNFNLLKEDEDLVLPAPTDLVTFANKGQYHGCSYSMKDKVRFIIDDCLTVRCTVTVLKDEPHVVESMIPSDLHQHLEQLLESGEGADVTFKVAGATFAAHRCVLAARSLVFKAQLFGGMKEKNMQCIKIEEMDDAVFKALLHFIYSDSVPPEIEEPQSSLSTLMAQHLLSAADRYDLKRLKLICEEKLCQNMDVDTVATTLALAEQHSCDRLKAACRKFIDSPGKLIAVAARTGGFDHQFIHSRNYCFYRRHDITEDSFVFSHRSFKTDGQPNLRCWNPSVCIIPTRFSGMVGISKHTVKAYDSYAAPLRLMLLRLFQHQFLRILASSSPTRIGRQQQVNAEPIIVETFFAPVSSGSESLYMNRSKARNDGASISLIFMWCCILFSLIGPKN